MKNWQSKPVSRVAVAAVLKLTHLLRTARERKKEKLLQDKLTALQNRGNAARAQAVSLAAPHQEDDEHYIQEALQTEIKTLVRTKHLAMV